MDEESEISGDLDSSDGDGYGSEMGEDEMSEGEIALLEQE